MSDDTYGPPVEGEESDEHVHVPDDVFPGICRDCGRRVVDGR